MLLWPWDDWVRPIRTLFSRRRRSRIKPKKDKGVCCSCKLPFDTGKKRCVVDSCGHYRCYACLCAQDACPVCSREIVIYKPLQKTQQLKEKCENQDSNETSYRKRMKIDNDSTRISAEKSNIFMFYPERNSKRFSQASNISTEFSFDATFPNVASNNITLKPLYFEVPQTEEVSSFLYRDWIFQEICKVIETSNLKGILLVGDEGCGKTSLILQLVDWSSFGRKRKSGILNDIDPYSMDMFEKLASQVVGYHFCQTDCRETCLIPDFIHSLAAQLCQAPQLTEYKNFLLRDENCQQLLSLEACIEDPDKAFQKGILEPLVTLTKYPMAPSILVIDSVYESVGPLRSISSFLTSYINQFPSWLKNHLVIKSSSFKVIPVSLDEVFTLMFSLRFPSTATFSKVKPILEICLASQRPLTAIEVFYSLESASVTPAFLWSEFTQTLRILSGILIQRKDESLMLSHPALRRWLISNLKFSCNIRLGHSYLALLPTRLRYPLTSEKELELIFHLSRANLLEKEERFTELWVHHSSITPTILLKRPEVLFWPDELIIRLLLKAGAEPNATLDSPRRCPILNLASKLGFVDIVKLLLKFGANKNASDAFGTTPLMEAANQGYLKIAEVLLSAGAQICAQDKVGRCALCYAAEKGHLQLVDLIVESKNWPTLLLLSQAIQRALVAASGSCNFQMCEHLIKIRDTSEISVQGFMSACSRGQTAVCQFFLDGNLSGQDILFHAAARGHLPMLRALADKGLFLDIKDQNGRTALAWACVFNKFEAVNFLLEKGASMASKDKDLCTPLHLAAIYADGNIVSYLLSKTTDPEIKNKENKTPLECAVSALNVSATLSLLKGGVDIGI
ncbi:protein TANC2 [Trichonephila inaurata madagascariensis]|uniref:Protein TANC2 n=1 Tax=Trichonephila inaurata madagascariensis TaxID=2747483 RepID=A0A8X7BSG8_9ARAC|nr:protein TANC2 [Trichonephila inaurata madagascariensis]